MNGESRQHTGTVGLGVRGVRACVGSGGTRGQGRAGQAWPCREEVEQVRRPGNPLPCVGRGGNLGRGCPAWGSCRAAPARDGRRGTGACDAGGGPCPGPAAARQVTRRSAEGGGARPGACGRGKGRGAERRAGEGPAQEAAGAAVQAGGRRCPRGSAGPAALGAGGALRGTPRLLLHSASLSPAPRMSGAEGAHFRRAAIRRKSSPAATAALAAAAASNGAAPTCPAGPPPWMTPAGKGPKGSFGPSTGAQRCGGRDPVVPAGRPGPGEGGSTVLPRSLCRAG